MNHDQHSPATNADRQKQINAARESFSGKTLTKSQFREAWAISGILQQEIGKTGSFREKLTGYAHAFARSEKFDALRGETTIRDIYTARRVSSKSQENEGHGLESQETRCRQHAAAMGYDVAAVFPDMITARWGLHATPRHGGLAFVPGCTAC